MKLLLLLGGIMVLSLSFHPPIQATTVHNKIITDTDAIQHVPDGKTTEWPADKFEVNKETNISLAVDNDEKSLYVALIVPGVGEQMKMTRNGMKLYVDTKGKKKEGKGVEFPTKKDRTGFESSGFNRNGGGNGEERQKPDFNQMRSTMALNMFTLKVFGFSDDDSKDQGLTMPGSVNIQYSWDSTNKLHIEYEIPLEMIGGINSLNKKEISVGWKIQGADMQSAANASGPTTTRTRLESRPSGSSRPSGDAFGGSSNSNRFEEMMKDQSFWRKYSIR